MEPSEASIRWGNWFPKPFLAAKKINVAPVAAAVTLKKVPKANPNKNPPVTDAHGYPSKAKVTRVKYEIINIITVTQ